MKEFGERIVDALQNVDFGIIEVCRADGSLLAVDGKGASDALVRHYHAEEAQREPLAAALSERAQRVFVSRSENMRVAAGQATGSR